MSTWIVEFFEVRKVTIEVEMEEDMPREEVREDFRDLPPEERAIGIALEGDGREIDAEFQEIFEAGPDVPEERRPKARKKNER